MEVNKKFKDALEITKHNSLKVDDLEMSKIKLEEKITNFGGSFFI